MNKQGEIIGLAHIGIHTDNLQESIEFYTDVLGFTLDHTADLHGGELDWHSSIWAAALLN